jgi:hypothetical protein
VNLARTLGPSPDRDPARPHPARGSNELLSHQWGLREGNDPGLPDLLMTINGKRSVAGVTSFGYGTKTRESVGRGYYARVDLSADFIDRTAGGWSATLAE